MLQEAEEALLQARMVGPSSRCFLRHKHRGDAHSELMGELKKETPNISEQGGLVAVSSSQEIVSFA